MKTKSLLHPKNSNFSKHHINETTSCNLYNVLKPNINLNHWKRCGIIFVKEYNCQKYLLVVKGSFSGIWSLPKGRIQEGETEEECASREVYEETGVNIHPNFINSLPKINIDYNVYFILNLDTMSQIDESKFKYNINDKNEVCEIAWKSFNELYNLHCNKDIRNILKQTIIYY